MSGNRDETLDLVDRALAKSIQIVVLDGGVTAGKLYEAACLLKSLVKGRAYLLIAERVDIATAVGASGVALSDDGKTNFCKKFIQFLAFWMQFPSRSCSLLFSR